MLIKVTKNLKLNVKSEKLFDFKNPSIIMCDSDLEIALNVKDLHVTEIRDQILKQMILVKQENWFKNYNTYMCKNKDTSISSKRLDTPSTLVRNPKAKYVVKPPLMQLLRTECEKRIEKKQCPNLMKYYIYYSRMFQFLRFKITVNSTLLYS